MSQELAQAQPAGALVSSPDDFINTLINVGSELGTGGTQFLRYAKGEWSVGRDKAVFPGNTFTGVPDIPNAVRGYQCWKGGDIVDEHWGTLKTPLPPISTMADHGPYAAQNEGWSEALKLRIAIIPTVAGGDIVEALWTANSAGARTALGGLLKEYGEALRAGVAIGKYPVVAFSSDSYQHTKFGKVHVPMLTIVRWADDAEAASYRKKAATNNAAEGAKAMAAARPAPPVGTVSLDDDIPF